MAWSHRCRLGNGIFPMTRTSLATLVLSSLLALPAMAQEATPAKPVEAPVAVVPTTEPRMIPTTPPVPQVQVPKTLTETEAKLRALLMKNREISLELSKRRVDILKAHPEIGEKIAAERAESEEARNKAQELRKQANELDQQAARSGMTDAERVYSEIDPEFAAKSKEQADLVAEIRQVMSEVTAERQKRAAVTPNSHLQKHAKPKVKPALAPEENQAEAKPAE